MTKRILPDVDVLRHIFDYEAETGVLRWRIRNDFAVPLDCQRWNKRFSGKAAGSLNVFGYLMVAINGVRYPAHNIIWKLVYGFEPHRLEHKNDDGTDNRIANLVERIKRGHDRIKIRQRAKRYYAKNPEKCRARRRLYRIKNIERSKRAERKYYLRFPEKKAALNRKRRALHAGAAGSHTDEDIKRLIVAQKGKCAYCAKKLNGIYHVDHITPLTRGGSNNPSNLQICCVGCNTRKNAKDPVEFARSLGLIL